ncbi:UDP-Glycosyltransferase superfamily protein [Rhynchospora pubera]|uniref:2,4-dihydroxy-7-methoxy-2H-1,4-benzoxazin-3(4H)-one 2-D-glucosyltransferase n=1 Tax=Rhynchospora pubera TaxID=906938 RepID=A0AAV8HV71_9POAL|nr:UDP-Glycosyltransferase superfamily protein [Rhynchospora pubera]
MKNQRRRRQVLLFPFPLQGHINPMLALASMLHSRGSPITIFHTHYNSGAIDRSSKHPSYRFIEIPDQVSNFRSSSQDNVLSLIRLLNDNCTEPFHRHLAQVLSDTDDDTPCLVLDMHWYKMNPVAKVLGVPTLVLRTGSAASLNGFIALPALYRKGILPSRAQVAEWEMEAAVEELPPLKVKDMIAVGNDREELLSFVALDAENARTSAGIIINTSDALESAELEKLRSDLSLPVFAVGPLHKFATRPEATNSSSLWPVQGRQDEDRMCMEWLDSQDPRSVLYVSFGSLASVDRSDFTEMAWGLANSGRPFLWVIRPGSVKGLLLDSALPDGLFGNGTAIRSGIAKIVEWAPQRDVLKHRAVGGFWTHCGWNSTLEALTEGVPVICTPFFSDQMGNTRYMADVWKVGVELRVPLERGRVEGAIRRMLTTGDGEAMRARAQELQRVLANANEEGGSSCQAADDLLSFLSSL